MKQKLEKARSFAGPLGAKMNLAELIEFLADLGIKSLEEKKFGKKSVKAANAVPSTPAHKLSRY